MPLVYMTATSDNEEVASAPHPEFTTISNILVADRSGDSLTELKKSWSFLYECIGAYICLCAANTLLQSYLEQVQLDNG